MRAHRAAQLGVGQREVDRGLQEAFLAAAVVALAFVAVGLHALLADQRRNAVGELDLATRATRLLADALEHGRREDVSPGHRQRGRRLLRRRLFHHGEHLGQGGVRAVHVDHAVAFGLGARHVLHGQHSARAAFVSLHHLRQHGGTARELVLAQHQVIGQQHREGLVAHHALGAQHRMAQAQRARLAHVEAVHVIGLDGGHQVEQRTLAGGLQLGLQLVSHVEVVLDGALVAAGDKDHLADAGLVGLFHGVLHQRLVHHRQHLFGNGLGGGKEPGAEAAHGKYGFTNRRHVLQCSRAICQTSCP